MDCDNLIKGASYTFNVIEASEAAPVRVYVVEADGTQELTATWTTPGQHETRALTGKLRLTGGLVGKWTKNAPGFSRAPLTAEEGGEIKRNLSNHTTDPDAHAPAIAQAVADAATGDLGDAHVQVGSLTSSGTASLNGGALVPEGVPIASGGVMSRRAAELIQAFSPLFLHNTGYIDVKAGGASRDGYFGELRYNSTTNILRSATTADISASLGLADVGRIGFAFDFWGGGKISMTGSESQMVENNADTLDSLRFAPPSADATSSTYTNIMTCVDFQGVDNLVRVRELVLVDGTWSVRALSANLSCDRYTSKTVLAFRSAQAPFKLSVYVILFTRSTNTQLNVYRLGTIEYRARGNRHDAGWPAKIGTTGDVQSLSGITFARGLTLGAGEQLCDYLDSISLPVEVSETITPYAF